TRRHCSVATRSSRFAVRAAARAMRLRGRLSRPSWRRRNERRHGMNEILRQILAGATEASWLEQGATVLGVLFVWLAMRENLWNFPVGLVQAAIFGWVCFEGKLYSETVLQALFFVAMIYGWWHWARGGNNAAPLAVQRLTPREAIAWVVVTLALWGVWGAG